MLEEKKKVYEDPKEMSEVLNIFFYSIVSDILFPPEMSLKGMTTAEEPPPLPIHTLPPYLFNHCLSISNSFMHVLLLLHTILSSYNWPSSPPRILSFTHMYFLSITFCTHTHTLSSCFHKYR